MTDDTTSELEKSRQLPISRARSTGRCNTSQCVDSNMFPRTKPSVWPYSIKIQPAQRSCWP